jgi:hypothetical protein
VEPHDNVLSGEAIRQHNGRHFRSAYAEIMSTPALERKGEGAVGFRYGARNEDSEVERIRVNVEGVRAPESLAPYLDLRANNRSIIGINHATTKFLLILDRSGGQRIRRIPATRRRFAGWLWRLPDRQYGGADLRGCGGNACTNALNCRRGVVSAVECKPRNSSNQDC